MNDESDQNTPDQAYRVGRGKPPLHSRFVKGQSGNPSGKRKRGPSLRSDFEAEANESIRLNEKGKQVKLTKQRAALRAQFHRAIKGDPRAFANLARLAIETAPRDDTDAGAQEPLSEAEEALLADFLQALRKRQEGEE